MDRKGEGHNGAGKMLNHIDAENKRVKDVTDAIMYDLLPAAIASVTQEVDEVPQELTCDICQVCCCLCTKSLLLCKLLISAGLAMSPVFLCSKLLDWYWWLRAC